MADSNYAALIQLVNALHASLDAHRRESMEQITASNVISTNTLKAMVNLQGLIGSLAETLTDTRDNRYQEEIEVLEKQIDTLNKQIADKQNARTTSANTSDRLRDAAQKAAKELQLQARADEDAKKVDWRRWFIDKVLPYLAGAAILGTLLNWGEIVHLLFGK